MKSEFIGCHDCKVLYPTVGPPHERSDEAGEAAHEGYVEFLNKHSTHSTVRLVSEGSAMRCNAPLWDPMAVVTFAVSDGKRSYLVSTRRASIEAEREYHFAPGKLEAAPAEVSVEDADLCRGLDRELYPNALRPAKLAGLVSALQDVIDRIDPQELDIAFDDANDPSISIAPMPESSYQELLARCAVIFDSAELPRVSRFLQANRDEDGLLALRVRQEYRLLAA